MPASENRAPVPEEVVLVSEDGRPIGRALKSAVHTADTPLHLAFSCWVVGERGVLVTRRALSKLTWPGVWTNSFCGHPAPGEDMADAVARRGHAELGLAVSALRVALPDFRYRAVDASGVVENEVCPVHLAQPASEPDPNPAEVMEHRWVPAADLVRAVEAVPWAFSPWMALQAPLLRDQLL